MNNTFNVTHRNAAKAVAIFFIIVLAIALFAGCGDSDNPTGGNGNPPPVTSNDSLILSLDSFNLSGTGSLSIDTLFNLVNSTFDSLKITFNVSSNCDTLDNAVLNVTFGNSGLLFFHRDLNASYTLFSAKNDTFWFALFSQFNTSQQRYIRATNFKLYLR